MTCFKAAARAASAALCLCFAARADVLTQGVASVRQPAVGAAIDDTPAALSENPGGLGFVTSLSLDYLRQQAFADRGGSGDALFAAGALGPLVLGGGIDWQRPDSCFSCDRVRRISLGVALRFGVASLGVVRHSFSSDTASIDHLASWDVGLTIRPERFLSLSFSALDVDEPRIPGFTVQRRYVAGLGLRPFGEAVTLGADVAFLVCGDGPGDSPLGPCGAKNPGVRFTADVLFARGVHVIGEATRNAQLERWSGQVGLAFDFGHAGVRYAQAISHLAGGQGNLKVHLSAEELPGIRAGSHAALVKLDEALGDKGPGLVGSLLGGVRHDPHAATLAALHKLANDPSVKAVVLKSSGLPGSMGKAEELRRSITTLRTSGKKVLFFLESGGDLEYYVASAADRIYAAPQSVLAINGFSATALFAASGLQKLGVKAEFVRVGAYKNFPDTFTRESMSAEQHEVEDALLDDVYGRFVHEVAARRSLPEEKLKALLDRGLLRPKEALEAGLLDGLVYPDQLEEEVGKALGGPVALREVAVPGGAEHEVRWGGKPRIALIRVEGNIAQGETRSDPFGAVQMVGSATVVRQIRKAADDPAVKAIVVRIDSPGGDGNASDLIWRELDRVRKEKRKPVVASMGDVAASGGYYVAVAADEIFAEPLTITGSIGVFVPKFSAVELYEKLGLRFETVKRGKSADLFGTSRPLAEDEKQMLQEWVNEFYEAFLDRVARGRGLTRDQVDAVARGRVWTGRRALEKKLVDQLGGLEEALASAKARAGLSQADVEVVDAGSPASIGLSQLAGASLGVEEKLDAAFSLLAGLPSRDAVRVLRALQLIGDPGTLRAVLPYSIELH